MTTKQKKNKLSKGNIEEKDIKKLVLFNDDVNSFDFVIESLQIVCNFNANQAETCTWIAHFKGKCTLKKGSVKKLKPYWKGLTDRNLKVEIQ